MTLRTMSLRVALLCCCWNHHSVVQALKTPTATPTTSSCKNIQVTPVTTHRDVIDLANLRYNEWIATTTATTSRSAFAQATAQIIQERIGATVFMARLNGMAVGAAELSPLEFDNVVEMSQGHQLPLYVTDVVTCREHRRMGIGKSLMMAVEDTAVDLGSSELFLHVEQENIAALQFYKRQGYQSQDSFAGIDTHRLAENAGTLGQLLLSKVLLPKKEKDDTTNRRVSKTHTLVGGAGFGGSSSSRRKIRSK